MENEKQASQKIKKFGESLKEYAAYIGAIVFLWSFASPFVLNFWKERSSNRLDEYDRMFKIYAKIVEAETDIDTKLFHDYGIELYHCNKNRKGQPKFSFVKHKGKIFEAVESKRKAGVWVYVNELNESVPVIKLRHE